MAAADADLANLLRAMALLSQSSDGAVMTLTHSEHGGRLSKEQFKDMTDTIDQVASMLQLLKAEAPCIFNALKLKLYTYAG
jgi:hypothetical protein